MNAFGRVYPLPPSGSVHAIDCLAGLNTTAACDCAPFNYGPTALADQAADHAAALAQTNAERDQARAEVERLKLGEYARAEQLAAQKIHVAKLQRKLAQAPTWAEGWKACQTACAALCGEGQDFGPAMKRRIAALTPPEAPAAPSVEAALGDVAARGEAIPDDKDEPSCSKCREYISLDSDVRPDEGPFLCNPCAHDAVDILSKALILIQNMEWVTAPEGAERADQACRLALNALRESRAPTAPQATAAEPPRKAAVGAEPELVPITDPLAHYNATKGEASEDWGAWPPNAPPIDFEWRDLAERLARALWNAQAFIDTRMCPDTTEPSGHQPECDGADDPLANARRAGLLTDQQGARSHPPSANEDPPPRPAPPAPPLAAPVALEWVPAPRIGRMAVDYFEAQLPGRVAIDVIDSDNRWKCRLWVRDEYDAQRSASPIERRGFRTADEAKAAAIPMLQEWLAPLYARAFGPRLTADERAALRRLMDGMAACGGYREERALLARLLEEGAARPNGDGR